VRIPESEKADSAAREAHAEYLNRTKEYPPQDLANWITEQHGEKSKNTL
jgi:hypothetical protein